MSAMISKAAIRRNRIKAVGWTILFFSVAAGALSLNGLLRSKQSANSKTSTEAASKAAFALSDVDEDGLPDGLALHGADAENFRKWFALIAEYQFYRISPKWYSEQRDCSGLVRFAAREALKKHNHLWLHDFGGDGRLIAAGSEDVRAYNIEESPLGENIFRSREGKFQPSDLEDGAMTAFADARTLRAFNVRFISRSASSAKPGDLLFYFDPSAETSPFHIMIFLGVPAWEADGSRDWVVYHTGATIKDPGVVKKVHLAELMKHPDKRWHPAPGNPFFLGFYRLKLAS